MNLEKSYYSVKPEQLEKSLVVPTSKSYANRLLILAAIDKSEVTLKNLPESTDVINMLKCFKEIGLDIHQSGSDCIIKNSFPDCEQLSDKEEVVLHTGDGGTTNRFIIPFLGRGKKKYKIIPDGHMRKRPMEEVINGLKAIGVDTGFEDENCWIWVRGAAKQGTSVKISCEKSTQFVTGFMLAFADKSISIEAINLDGSLAYFNMTKYLVDRFQKQVEDYVVPVDYSSISYPLALGALSGKLTLTNVIEKDPYQADSVFLDILEAIGASLKWESGGLVIKPSLNLLTISHDCSGCPDLTPTLAFLAAHIDGESVLKNLEVLRYKESDRIEEIIDVLKAFDVKYRFDKEKCDLYINGSSTKTYKKITYEPPADHRIIMMTYLFMIRNQGGEISNIHHVKKSFPTFTEVFSN